jgi:hypothetical protein
MSSSIAVWYPGARADNERVTVRRRLVLASAALAVVALAGCKVDADVDITLRDDGSGTIDAVIRLDAEAVAGVERDGRTLDTAIPLDDLRAAGWEVSVWERGADGSASLFVGHDFAGESELDRRVTELVGPTGLLRDPQLTRERGILRSRDELSIEGDLRSPGTGIQQDPELVAALQAAGLDVAALDQQLQAELREALSLDVTVEVEGERTETVALVPGEQERVVAAHSRFDSGRLALFCIAGLLAFLGVLLYLSASVGARRERSRRAVAQVPERSPLM